MARTRSQRPDAGDEPPRRLTRSQLAHERLVRAAQEVLSTVGPSASIHLIAERAEVGVGTIYRQFGSKEGLLEHATREALLDFEAWMLRNYTGGIEDPLERFSTSMRIYLRMPMTHPVNARVLIQPETVLLSDSPNYPKAARNDLDASIAAGRVTCPDPHLRLTLVQNITRGMLLLGVAKGGTLDTAFLDDAAEECLMLLGARRAEARRLAHLPLADALPA